MSVSRKCFKTVWPNEPVPPVINRVELAKLDTVSKPPFLIISVCILRKLFAKFYCYRHRNRAKTVLLIDSTQPCGYNKLCISTHLKPYCKRLGTLSPK